MSLDFSIASDLIWILFTIGIWLSIAFDIADIVKRKAWSRRSNKGDAGASVVKVTSRLIVSIVTVLYDDELGDSKKVDLLKELLLKIDGE